MSDLHTPIPKDEQVTTLQGKAYVAFGEDGSKENAHEFGQGDCFINARGAIHSVWADSTTVMQISGNGPWEEDFAEN